MAARYITNNGHATATATATATVEHGEAKRVNYRSDNGRGGYFDSWAACRRAFLGGTMVAQALYNNSLHL
jgi:hypothetical protein